MKRGDSRDGGRLRPEKIAVCGTRRGRRGGIVLRAVTCDVPYVGIQGSYGKSKR